MKKSLQLAALLFLSFLLTQCGSSDDDTQGTLFVNGNVFKIGTNTAERTFNYMFTNEGSNSVQFTIVEKTTQGTEPEVFNIWVTPPTADLNHTYEFYANETDPETLPENYAHGEYLTPPLTFDDSNISGTVKVTDLGNMKYKLEFNDVVFTASDGSGATKVLSGYCQPTFF